jgi:hypothetical protein
VTTSGNGSAVCDGSLQYASITAPVAVVHGGADEARISELRALAEAEATPVNSMLMQAVQSAVTAELADLYEPVAGDAYRVVAQAFTTVAGKFLGCASKADDVEAQPEAMVGQSAAARAAWIDGIGHAGALDALLPVLVAGAELAGTVITDDTELISLIIRNADTLHRRQLWDAFL